MPRQRVLVVEDEPTIRSLMAEVLTDAGYEVDEASTSDEAVLLLDADGYKLLVTDMHMPGQLDGKGVADHAHELKPQLPVIFVTGRPDFLSRLTGGGIKGLVLPKPFQLNKLVGAVQNLIDPDSE